MPQAARAVRKLMNKEENKADWFAWTLQSIVGAVVGALIGGRPDIEAESPITPDFSFWSSAHCLICSFPNRLYP